MESKKKPFEMFKPTNRRALVRSRGLFKVVCVATRGGSDYVQHGSGFAKVCGKVGNEWTTSISRLMVLDISEWG